MQVQKPKLGYKFVKWHYGKSLEIPDDWVIERLGSFLYVNMGQSPPSEEYHTSALGLPFFQGVTEFGFIHPHPRIWCNKPGKIANVGEILISVRAPVGEVNLTDARCGIGRGIASLRPNSSDLKYSYYLLMNFKSNFLKYSQGVTYDAINRDELSQTLFPYTKNIKEQQKIASILSKVDELIQKAIAIVDQTQRLKKGIIQSMFARGVDEIGQIRTDNKHAFRASPIGKIPDVWQLERLNNISERVSVGIATSTTKHFVEKGIPLLRNQNIKEGEIDTRDLLFISEEFAKANNSKRLKPGDVLCVRTGMPGQSAVVTAEMDGWQTFTTLIIRPLKEFILPYYLCWFLNSNRGRRQTTSIQGGGVQRNLNAGWLSSMWIPVPSINEQKRIVRLIENNLQLIESEKQLLYKLKELQKGLMQRLLTGQILVKA